MFQKKLTYITKLNLKGETLRVYIILLSKLDYINWLRIKPKDIAEELEMKPSYVSKALKELSNHGILVKGPKADISNTYRLNSLFTFRRREKNSEQIRQEVKNN